MKKVLISIRKTLLPIIGIFFLAILFGSCKKDDVVVPRTPVAGLMAVNLIPNSGTIGVAIGENSITPQPLYYNNFTGTYRPVNTGERILESYSFGTGSTLAKDSYTFSDSAYYTVFVMGANDVYTNVFVQDDLQNIPQGDKTKTYVRFVNAIPDSSSTKVSIAAGGNNTFDVMSRFKDVSPFKEIPSGEVVVKAENESVLITSRTINLEKGKIYTVLIMGIPESLNNDFKPEIKYILNANL